MNNKQEIAFGKHIKRLSKDITDRDKYNPWHQELTRVDARNIASLREGRIPVYGDHMEMDNDIEMSEFADLTELVREVNPWPRAPAGKNFSTGE